MARSDSEEPQYEIWGNRLYASQIPIDTFIDFYRCWRANSGFTQDVTAENTKYFDKHHNYYCRLLLFEDYLPSHIWAKPGGAFSSVLTPDVVREFNKFLERQKDGGLFRLADFEQLGSYSDGTFSTQDLLNILRYFRSLKVSACSEIATNTDRKEWWAQYLPPYSENMFMMEVRFNKKSPFEIETFGRDFQSRSGEIFYKMLMHSTNNERVSKGIRTLFGGRNVYGKLFEVVRLLSHFLFVERRNDLLGPLLKPKQRAQLDATALKVEAAANESKISLGDDIDVDQQEVFLFDHFAESLGKILSSPKSVDYKISLSSRYMVFCNIRYLIWRANKFLGKEKYAPHLFFTFNKRDSLKALRSISHVNYSKSQQDVRNAYFELKGSKKYEDFKPRRTRVDDPFESWYFPYLGTRGKGLGIVYPKTGRYQHFNMTEEFLEFQALTLFENGEGILPLSDFLDRLFKKEGIVITYDHFKSVDDLTMLYSGDPHPFEENTTELCQQLKRLGLLIESSDSGLYVKNPLWAGYGGAPRCEGTNA